MQNQPDIDISTKTTGTGTQKTLLEEIDVVYVPSASRKLYVAQYPLLGRADSQRLMHFMEAAKCEWLPIQEELRLSMRAKREFENLRRTSQKGLATEGAFDSMQDEDGDDAEDDEFTEIGEKKKKGTRKGKNLTKNFDARQPVVTYVSRAIANRNNYFVARKGQEAKQGGKTLLILQAIEGWMQMRPQPAGSSLSQQPAGNQAAASAKGRNVADQMGKDLQRLDREIQREQNIVQRLQRLAQEKDLKKNHVLRNQVYAGFDKFLEQKERYYNNFTQLRESESAIEMQYCRYDGSAAEGDEYEERSFSSRGRFGLLKDVQEVNTLARLKAAPRREYVEKLEGK